MNPEVVLQKRTRQQALEDDYRANLYLAGKPDAHVLERFRYLLQCTTTLSATGQIGFETREALMPYLLRRQAHIQMELGIRGGIPAHAASREDLPKITHPEIPAGTRAYRGRKRPEIGQLFKFGQQHWLQAMIERGSIRFAPASSYSSPTFNNAIRDDELTFTYYPGKASPPLKVLRHDPGTDWMQIRHPSDFYLQCLTDRFAVRMFDDFGADSCLIIYDAKEFGQRVINALKIKFSDWFVLGVGVTYIDPDDPGDQEIFVPTTKHLRYIYQQEQRFICHPREPVRQLEAFTIEIGSLGDIAELVQT
ncbi:hypothetical protein [Opitutus terrae]|uniref:Uncharacterized protein n=1 Tax=Opitutus terrae (strain DSM 11246 / JCM 15787 / PB90-1) TaxID=452637 RepID=B1ZQ17_OPITP|nr:hypothetical protein [Opitutus terrae]ACB77736.1 hypothetical protein Oter_4465 [Opitutus terrae PB90-1]